MENASLELLKGVHPGLYLARELSQRRLHGGTLAGRIGGCRQNLHAILQGRRRMSLSLSLRIEQVLGLPEGFLMTLQLYYDIAEEKRRQSAVLRPDISKFRPALFWDVEPEKIDWQQHKAFIIQRVFERGDETEIKETLRFYGREEILRQLHTAPSPYSAYLKSNVLKYLGHEV